MNIGEKSYVKEPVAAGSVSLLSIHIIVLNRLQAEGARFDVNLSRGVTLSALDVVLEERNV